MPYKDRRSRVSVDISLPNLAITLNKVNEVRLFELF